MSKKYTTAKELDEKRASKNEDSAELDELRSWLPKAREEMNVTEKKKDLKSLDQWVAKFDDNAWKKLAQQNKTLWQITKTTKEFSDMSWKVAVNGAIFTLSGASKRDTYVHTLQEKVRMNTWNITLGYSGISRKTTTRNSINGHLEEITYLSFVPVKVTPEALYEEMKKTPNAVMLGDELGAFFLSLKRDFMAEMATTLSDFYDCKKKMEKSTKTGGRTTIIDPYLRIYGGGTKSVIKDLTEDLFEQGFLPRFHFVLDFNLENRDFKWILPPNPHLEKEYAKVSKELEKIGNLKVKKLLYNADIVPEFRSFEKYCKQRLFEHNRRGDEITAPYYSRLPFHALKIAGLLYLADLAYHKGTGYKVNILPPKYIILGTLFMRLYEQEYLQLVYLFKSSASAGRFDTQKKKLNYVENLLKLEGGITTYTKLLKDSGLESKNFDSVAQTLVQNGTIKQDQITKQILVTHNIIKTEDDKYPFRGYPPLLVWHKDAFVGVKKAIEHWIGKNSKS